MTFQAGKSGNPGGKPKQKPFRDALMMALKDAGEDMPALRDIAVTLVNKAREGDIQAIKELSDRLDGKVPQAVIGGDDDDPAMKVVAKVLYEIVEPKPSGS